MLDLARFYRLKTWYRNMGIAVIGVLASPVLDPVTAALSVLQVFLIQLHSFSMNDYYDHLSWDEENYVGRLLERGTGRKTMLALMVGPLALATALYPWTGTPTVLLPVYSILFYLYQGPARLKRHWAASILLNAVPLGWILFAYPYLVQTTQLTPEFTFFSALFLFYMAFFEIAHQVEHQEGEPEVHSLVDAAGEKFSLLAGGLLQTVPGIIGVILAVEGSLNPVLPATAAVFSLFRLYRVSGLPGGNTGVIRRSWHKFYTVFEGGIYVAVLFLSSPAWIQMQALLPTG